MLGKRQVLQFGLMLTVGLLAGILGIHQLAAAQSGVNLWTTPVNISKSGGASQPAIAVAPDGRLHALWWDSINGEEYAQTTTATGLDWTAPMTVTQIYGERRLVRSVETGKTSLVLQPPLDLQMLSDSEGRVYAFWRDVEKQLSSAEWDGTRWGDATVLADATLGIAPAADNKGAVHLVYVRSQDSPLGPPGLYYRSTSGQQWTDPVLVYTSLYYRTMNPEQVIASVASNGTGQVIIAWDDPGSGQSMYVLSSDSGRTWGTPQGVSKSPENPIVYGYVTSAPNGDFIVLGRDASAPGCKLNLWRSTDGGRTWAGPSLLSAEFSHCPQRMRFSLGSDSRLWLLGLPPLEGAGASGDVAALAAWDGEAWSVPGEVSWSFQDKATGREVSLGSLDLSLAGPGVGVVGTNAEGDVWAIRNALTLDLLAPAFKPVWDSSEAVSDQQTSAQVKDVPALVADQQGRLYALWSETPALSEPGQALYIALRDNGRWSRSTRVFQPAATTESAPTGNASIQVAEQPALGLDSSSRLHALWRGGGQAEILYSWTSVGDALLPSTWSTPVALPMPGRPGSWPDLAVDPVSDGLYAIYAVPYNERRGIYFVQSNDRGTTWSSPTVVFDAAASGQDSVDKPRLMLDAETSILHAVWLQTTLVGEPHGQAVMYARSTDKGQTWSAPVTLTVGASDWPRLAVVGADQIYVVWNRPPVGVDASTAPSEVRGIFSSDGGQRWTESQNISGIEVTGPVGLASDGAGGLLLLGIGQASSGEAMLLYSHWDGRVWSKVELSGLGQDGVSGNAVTAVSVSASHSLVAVMRESVKLSDGRGQFKLMATVREIAALPPVKLMPTFTPLPSVTPTLTPSPLATATALPLVNSTAPPQIVAKSPLPITLPLVVGGGAITLVIIGAVAFSVIRAIRR